MDELIQKIIVYKATCKDENRPIAEILELVLNRFLVQDDDMTSLKVHIDEVVNSIEAAPAPAAPAPATPAADASETVQN